MGTWDAGPFHNDAAMDFVGEHVDGLMTVLDAFLDEPEIDETFDEAFAALALLNGVMAMCSARPWDAEASAVRDPAPIRAAFLACYDEQIDGMMPDPDFKRVHREKLVEQLDRFDAFLAP